MPAPSPTLLAVLAGSTAGVLFLLPRLAQSAPFLALPLSIAGLFSAAPLLGLRISGRLIQAVIALATSLLLISVIESPDTAVGFAILFGVWALLAGEVLSRRKSVIAAGVAGFVLLSLEALLAGFTEGTAPIEATLRSPQVQASFDQWAAQAALEPAEAKAAIERVRSGIVALYPSLSVDFGRHYRRLEHRGPRAARPAQQTEPPSQRANCSCSAGRWLWSWRSWPPARLLLVPGLHTVAWNGLVVTLFLFLLQGLSVLAFALSRLFASELVRAMLMAASLLGPWAILLSLLGLFDQWFDFRSRFISAETPAAP